jgi:2-oxo-3-hexenedioate decarboxylase
VLDGLREQLASRRAELQGGARRVGWKIGLNVPAIQETLGIDSEVIGHLTSASLIEPGGEFSAAGAVRLVAEPEVAVEIGEGGTIIGYAPAIELADIDRDFDDVQAIVAGNIFHRAVVLGRSRPAVAARVTGSIADQPIDAEPELDRLVQLTAGLLEEVGESLQPGDRIITGSLVTPLPASPGDSLSLELEHLGSVSVSITD